MRLATLLVLVFALASCDTTTNSGPPIQLLVEAVSPEGTVVIAEVEIPRGALVGNVVEVPLPGNGDGFSITAGAGDSTGVYAIATSFIADTQLISLGGGGSSSQVVFLNDAQSVLFASTDSLWAGSAQTIPVSVETGVTVRRDTLRRERHRARAAHLNVEARGLSSAITDLRITVIAPRDLRLAPVASFSTNLIVPGGSEDEPASLRRTGLLRANLGNRARYSATFDRVATPPEAGPVGFDLDLEVLLVRTNAGL